MPKTITKASMTNRAGYQKGRALGNKVTAAVKDTGTTALGGPGGRSSYAKNTTPGDTTAASYGNTLPISDLQSITDFSQGAKPARPLKQGKAVAYTKSKGDAGSGFNLGKRR